MDGWMDGWMDAMSLWGVQQCKYHIHLILQLEILLSHLGLQVKSGPDSYLRNCDLFVLLILATSKAKKKQILLINMIMPDGKLIKPAS